MKILHTYCQNYNIGDYALAIGVKNLLRKYLDVDSIGETNIQGQYFNEYYINEVINKKYDLLVIGGGGIIHGAHWPNGWFWLIEKDLIKTIKIPFIVYGIGNNYFSNESIPKKAIDHIKETYRHSAFFSVRNDGSLDRVKAQIGISPFEVPDPGFHLPKKNQKAPTEKPYIIIQLAYDKKGQRFQSSQIEETFITSMRDTVKSLATRYRVLFAPHVYEDIEISRKISSDISNCEIWDFGKYAFDNCLEAIQQYQYAEFVLAMRGHGQIIPLGYNVPVIALVNHPKHSGLMGKLGLKDYSVNIHEPEFQNQLQSTINKLEKDRFSYIKKLILINRDLEENARYHFEIISAAII